MTLNKSLVASGLLLATPAFVNAATCGVKENIDAQCFASAHPDQYERRRPVAKMYIDKGAGNGGACTAWRVGSGDLMMTNYHCFQYDILSIDSPAEKLAKINKKMPNITLYFNYQNTTCGTDDSEATLLANAVSTTPAEALEFDEDLDFVLFRINNPSSVSQFGYFGIDTTRIDANSAPQQIFIPQHSNGDPKLMGLESDRPVDNGYCHMYYNNYDATRVNYYCDTQGMGSGSPVVNYDNGKVQALHFWGSDDANCDIDTNSAHQMADIWPHIATHFNNTVPDGDVTYGGGSGGGSGATVLSWDTPITIGGNSGETTLYEIDAASGLADVTITTSGGTGDADLYVKFGGEASSSKYDCKSTSGSSNESCTLTAQVGTYSVAVRGDRKSVV